MRNLILTTAAVAAAIAGAFAGEPSFGTFTDTRDGKTYNTVKIGKQTWMAQNLNYKTDSSWCYNGADSNCNSYGRLYAWNAAKTACPAGYHLPLNKEWDDLVASSGEGKMSKVTVSAETDRIWYGTGNLLKAKSGWNDYDGKNGTGTDKYGFSFLPAGYIYSNEDSFMYIGIGNNGYGWTATEINSDRAYYRNIGNRDDDMYEFGENKRFGYSVRCVADKN